MKKEIILILVLSILLIGCTAEVRDAEVTTDTTENGDNTGDNTNNGDNSNTAGNGDDNGGSTNGEADTENNRGTNVDRDFFDEETAEEIADNTGCNPNEAIALLFQLVGATEEEVMQAMCDIGCEEMNSEDYVC